MSTLQLFTIYFSFAIGLATSLWKFLSSLLILPMSFDPWSLIGSIICIVAMCIVWYGFELEDIFKVKGTNID